MGALRIFCLGIGVLVAGHAWADGCQLSELGTLPVEMVGAKAMTTVKINGTDARFALDTGATLNVMSKAAAKSLRLGTRRAPFGLSVTGIGGDVDAEIASPKDLGILGVTLHNIEFIVGGSDPGYGLIGASLLDIADLEIDLADGKMTLFKADHCGKATLAYWVKPGGDYQVADLGPSMDPHDQRTYLSVTINGKKARAVLDSGAYATIVSRRTAERAGIDLAAPGVKAAGQVKGVGAESVKAWIVDIDSLSVGTETIRHSQVEVIDGAIDSSGTDMLLGADFLLAHRMFIANSAEKAFFTYNGGRVFSFATAPSGSDKSDVEPSADSTGAPPKTASDYALLGEAHLSRGEANAAIADLNEAIRMAPDQAGYYLTLATAHAAAKQPDAVLADLDKSLSLNPWNAGALLLRAGIRLQRKDREGAAGDVATASILVPAGSAQAIALAELYIGLEQPAAALPLLDDWIRLHDDDASLGQALNLRCWARGLSNQMLDDALKDCRKAIHRDGESPSYLDSLGLVEFRLGHYAESIIAYQQSIAANTRFAWPHYGLGMAELRNGQADAGSADLAAARALDPQIEAHAVRYGLTATGPATAAPSVTGAAAVPRDEMINLLVNGNFADLDRRMMDLQRGFEAGSLTDFDLIASYRNFHSSLSPDAVAKLDEWVVQSPDSYVAHLARGMYLKNQGLSARGDKYISQTPPEAIAKAKEYFSQATTELEKSLPLTSKPYISLYELLGLAMESTGYRDKADKYLDEANQMAPDNSLIRDRYMVSLTPRWGGSYEQEGAFIQRNVDAGAPDKLIAQFRAIELNDQGMTFLEGKRPQEAKNLFVQALRLGEQGGSYFSNQWLAAAHRYVCGQSPEEDYCK